MNVSDVDRQHTGYNLHGIVDVPSHPRNDDERAFLAGVLFRYAELPDKGKRAYRLANWCAVEGGEGVKIEHCGPIPVFTEKNISNVKVFKPPEFEDLGRAELQGDNEHNTWRTEYHSNQYCRFESRKELNQRLQDIQVNTVILTPSGKMAFTENKVWYQLSQHVIDEMLIRGQPPHERNLDPRVELAMPFKDGELCEKAGEVISARGTSHDVIVKYGKYKHMKELYERGRVWMNPVTTYESSRNQAVRDNERTFVFKGGYRSKENPPIYFTKETAPGNFAELVDDGEINFVPIFDAPNLARHEFAELEVSMRNYWTYCMAGVLDPRLFADFNADACVIIRKRPFIERLTFMTQFVLRDVMTYFREVLYEDPLGVFSSGSRPTTVTSIRVYMTKLFRYAYQSEVRYVCIPNHPEENLKPVIIEIGSLSEIAELVALN